ncbi:MAG: TadE/TadG family type IV pilus assembly protein [Pseudomonadota bacterium]
MSFFRKLAEDPTANTLAISAASLVPLMAMVGGGVDASRYYMAETRLQAACDAGALAGRRAMGDGEFEVEPEGADDTPKETAENFFDQNYDEGLFGTENLQRTYATDADGTVNGTASGTIPTSIMGAFGFNQFDLTVACQADINISNTDIMFVLDVTGSMGGASGSTTRIQALRDAVMTFHATVEDSTSPNAQVRYGMMPYSTNVNVGEAVYKANPAWLAQQHTYQSRETEYTLGDFAQTSIDYVRTGEGYNYNFVERFENKTYHSTFDACVAHYNAEQVEDINPSGNPSGWTQVSATGTNPRTVVYNGPATYEEIRGAGGTYYYDTDLCDIDFDRYEYQADSTITVVEEAPEIPEWVYRQVSFDISGLYTGLGTQANDPFNPSVNLRTGWDNTTENIAWDGCLEEADTVVAANFNPVPNGANDLNINLTPSNPDELWKPVLFGAMWQRGDGGTGTFGRNINDRTLNEIRRDDPNLVIANDDATQTVTIKPPYSCPRRAFRLREINSADMLAEVNALTVGGNTYHDIGMIWGARFISPNGIFAGDNATAPNGDAISRHIVFMTDGTLQPFPEHYTAYGMEWWDRRISGNADSTDTFNNHAERFQAACRLARQENVSVWVVAFGTTLTQNLIDCATPGRAFAASDAATLDQRFREIAQQIAALRLTQ